jgi:ribosomal protein S18 acetylase RimI-like enzyme
MPLNIVIVEQRVICDDFLNEFLMPRLPFSGWRWASVERTWVKNALNSYQKARITSYNCTYMKQFLQAAAGLTCYNNRALDPVERQNRMSIRYINKLDNITADSFAPGFFDGWGNPPNRAKHLALLQGSYRVWLAVDDETQQVVGFITAISDGVLAAFIPLLEVVPAYKKQGIGTELTRRMLDSLNHLYAVDLICDTDVQPFYERVGMRRYTGMIQRNYDRQDG